MNDEGKHQENSLPRRVEQIAPGSSARAAEAGKRAAQDPLTPTVRGAYRARIDGGTAARDAEQTGRRVTHERGYGLRMSAHGGTPFHYDESGQVVVAEPAQRAASPELSAPAAASPPSDDARSKDVVAWQIPRSITSTVSRLKALFFDDRGETSSGA